MTRARPGLRLARTLARELTRRQLTERRRDTCTWGTAERWSTTLQYERLVRPEVRPDFARGPNEVVPEPAPVVEGETEVM